MWYCFLYFFFIRLYFAHYYKREFHHSDKNIFLHDLPYNNILLSYLTYYYRSVLYVLLISLEDNLLMLRQFGIKKSPKKLVISLLFCNFIVENQSLTKHI